MNSVENYAIRYLEPKDVKDLDQYNALLRYTFQVTEDELTATGWKDEEIKQSKFPVLERADVLGCFDGGYPDFPVCRISIENEYIRGGISRWICYECLYISGIYRAGHYEKTDVSESGTYETAGKTVCPPVSIFHTAVSSSGLGDHIQ